MPLFFVEYRVPELPEVETMVRDLRTRLVGQTIESVEASFRGSIVWPSFDEFEAGVTGRRIEGVERRGKYAQLLLDTEDLLVVHRGMTGSLLLRTPADPMELHVRLLFRLSGGKQLRFNDPRKFGKVLLLGSADMDRPAPWARMGPEPLGSEFSLAGFGRALQRRTALIKPLLLGQQVVAGLGNIYVDEALHRAGIHPERRAYTLRPAEVKRLHNAIRDTLGAAVDGRGTTFSNYTDIEGRAGRYQQALQVFHRTGQPCPRCGTTIRRLVVAGRGTHICPHCQKA